MDKEFSTITLNYPSDFYRRNLFSSTTMTVNGATYEIVSVNPTADAPTVSEIIKYLIKGIELQEDGRKCRWNSSGVCRSRRN